MAARFAGHRHLHGDTKQTAILREKLERIQIRKFLKGEPSFGAGLPNIELLADQVLDQRRVLHSFLDLVCQGFCVFDGPETRVRFFPALGVCPLGPGVQLIDKSDGMFVVISFGVFVSVDQAISIVILFVVDILADHAGCGTHEDQRLISGCDAVGDDVEQRPAVLPLMDLVKEGT